MQESGDAITGIAIGSERVFLAVYTHALLEMFDKRLKITKQGCLSGSLAQQQIPYLFGGHDLPYRRLFLVDGQCRGTQFVQLPVDLPRSGALSRSAARCPRRYGNRHLGTESRLGMVADGQPCHDRTTTIGIRFALFKVERDPYIHLFHNSIYLIAKLVDIELFEAMKNIAEQRNRIPDRINAAVFSR